MQLQASNVVMMGLLLDGVMQASDVEVMWLLLLLEGVKSYAGIRGESGVVTYMMATVLQISDVRAVWRLHTVLPLINFETPSAADLKNLLGRCCSSAQYLKIDEVRHAHACTHTHARTHAYTHSHSHPCTCTHTHTHFYACMHGHSLTLIHSLSLLLMHTLILTLSGTTCWTTSEFMKMSPSF